LTGTANVETGTLAPTFDLTWRLYTGLSTDHPCPRCLGDGTSNDGIMGGTCNDGPRVNLACDANGSVPGFPDFGTESLDCPMPPGSLIGTTPIHVAATTSGSALTISSASPNCTGGVTSLHCACETCNDATGNPCASNADCPTNHICGGKRCIGG